MLNPIPPVEPPSKPEQVKIAVSNTVKKVGRERELVIAVLFWTLGFIGGKF